jgi:hypothetical protein
VEKFGNPFPAAVRGVYLHFLNWNRVHLRSSLCTRT